MWPKDKRKKVKKDVLLSVLDIKPLPEKAKNKAGEDTEREEGKDGAGKENCDGSVTEILKHPQQPTLPPSSRSSLLPFTHLKYSTARTRSFIN